MIQPIGQTNEHPIFKCEFFWTNKLQINIPRKRTFIIFLLNIYLLVVIFAGSYQISEAALSSNQTYIPKNSLQTEIEDFKWYQDTAIFICPLH